MNRDLTKYVLSFGYYFTATNHEYEIIIFIRCCEPLSIVMSVYHSSTINGIKNMVVFIELRSKYMNDNIDLIQDLSYINHCGRFYLIVSGIVSADNEFKTFML